MPVVHKPWYKKMNCSIDISTNLQLYVQTDGLYTLSVHSWLLAQSLFI